MSLTVFLFVWPPLPFCAVADTRKIQWFVSSVNIKQFVFNHFFPTCFCVPQIALIHSRLNIRVRVFSCGPAVGMRALLGCVRCNHYPLCCHAPPSPCSAANWLTLCLISYDNNHFNSSFHTSLLGKPWLWLISWFFFPLQCFLTYCMSAKIVHASR